MLNATLFHNSIQTSTETKPESTWLDYKNKVLYWHGQKKSKDG
jgi:hypothetical protein